MRLQQGNALPPPALGRLHRLPPRRAHRIVQGIQFFGAGCLRRQKEVAQRGQGCGDWGRRENVWPNLTQGMELSKN